MQIRKVKPMINRLPLSNLPTFDAAARHESFALAAKEMNLSQAAVSRQIKTLEDHLHTQLFVRSHRAVRLTKHGEELHQTVQLVLRLLGESIRNFGPRPDNTSIRIASDLAFAHFWLLPRLAQIQEAAGRMSISVMASDDEDECLADAVDISLAYGDGNWPGFTAHPLLEEDIFPVCSPGYLSSLGAVRKPADLLRGSFLHVGGGPATWVGWHEWFSHFNVEFSDVNKAFEFNSMPWSIQFACAGKGIALGWKHLLDDLLNDGSLVRPIPDSIRTGRKYYVLSRSDKHMNCETDNVCKWLAHQAEHPAIVS